jgi:diguanylate cyclase (GGDEF)-like protein/PAS domain S-box-containing protein
MIQSNSSSNPVMFSDGATPFQGIRASLDDLQRLLESPPGLADNVQMRVVADTIKDLNCQAETIHRNLVTRSQTLSLAQADAIVRSAEIIDELERTKLELIEARRESERHQAEHLMLLRGVFENAREAVVILDRAARIQEVNPAFAEITGRPRETLFGHELDSTLEGAFPEYHSAIRLALSGQAWSGQIVLARSNGEERTYLLSFSPIHSDTHSPYIIALFSDVTEIDRTQRRLQKQALHDQLTGLPNRRFYRDRLQSLIDESGESQTCFTLCFIDLDDFKSVNDSLGHSAGDELIVEVARRIQKAAGDQSFVSRFGGDEFAILIPHTDQDFKQIATITDEVLQQVRAPFQLGNMEVRVRASLGIAEFPLDGEDPDELMQNADMAMYSAKKSGRNQIRCFSRRMKQEVDRRNQIQRQLHEVVSGKDLSIEYQPVVDFRTRGQHSCEALARWRTATGEFISPGEFIPVAEQSGLIIQLGDAILAQVCRQLADWNRRGLRPPRVAVNLSPKQFRSTSFLKRTEEILKQEGASPEWLTFEVTETAMMEDVSTSLRVLDSLEQMGFKLALDDFGTGHSSLSYLQKINIHILKIDKSFIVDLSRDDRAFSIVESVIRLGQSRGLSIVAEGIETRSQWDLLKEMGCDYGQGYYIARPMSPIKMECLEALVFA